MKYSFVCLWRPPNFQSGSSNISHICVLQSKLHKATLVNTDVGESLSESVSETNTSELMNHKRGFTSGESLEGCSDTMTAGVSRTSKTPTEQQCLTQEWETAEVRREYRICVSCSHNPSSSLACSNTHTHTTLPKLSILW